MPCDSCGHPKMAHRETTLSVYFCSQCQKIESHVTFTSDRQVEASTQPSGEDLLSELYYSHKAFRQSSSTAF